LFTLSIIKRERQELKIWVCIHIKEKSVEKKLFLFHVFNVSLTFREVVEYIEIFERYVCLYMGSISSFGLNAILSNIQLFGLLVEEASDGQL